MALPKSKYSEPKHTPGKEFKLNGQEYRGWYITTYKGKNYTGKVYDSNSKLLLPIIESITDNKPPFSSQQIEPNTSDIKAGNFKRYFVQKKSNKRIIEVQRTRFTEFEKYSEYNKGILDWKIKGPAENQNIKGYVYIGAKEINMQNTNALESTVPGISAFIKDYSQFVE